ncbi:hypothetical protein WJX73_001343 [Symbiochloris irregularis]|uniref:Uncharacterized protein n=1 Tax=Symbiochloris irregularis TaxID=706552 RepID=A0AAW1NNG3_9CHLO
MCVNKPLGLEWITCGSLICDPGESPAGLVLCPRYQVERLLETVDIVGQGHRTALSSINAAFHKHFRIPKAQIMWTFARSLRLLGNVELTFTDFGERTLADVKWASRFTNKRRGDRMVQTLHQVDRLHSLASAAPPVDDTITGLLQRAADQQGPPVQQASIKTPHLVLPLSWLSEGVPRHFVDDPSPYRLSQRIVGNKVDIYNRFGIAMKLYRGRQPQGVSVHACHSNGAGRISYVEIRGADGESWLVQLRLLFGMRQWATEGPQYDVVPATTIKRLVVLQPHPDRELWEQGVYVHNHFFDVE